jgi:hypothetical protein
MRIWGKKFYPRTLHLREIAALIDILCCAYYTHDGLQEFVLKKLTPVADRFDVSAFLFLFEFTLPLTTVLYDSVFKAGRHEEYLEGLALYWLQMMLWQRRNYKFGTLYKLAHAEYLRDRHPQLFEFSMCSWRCTLYYT